jgi:hypothetical protein
MGKEAGMTNEKVEQTARNSHAHTTHLDRLLDEALEETFPASDPVSICSDDRAPEGEKTSRPGSAADSPGARSNR